MLELFRGLEFLLGDKKKAATIMKLMPLFPSLWSHGTPSSKRTCVSHQMDSKP